MLIRNPRLISVSLFLAASTSIAALGFALAFRWAQVNFASGLTKASVALLDSNKEQDGLVGPVHRVRTERAQLLVESGKLVESPRELLETTAYDLKGNRISNSYYLVQASSPTGREEYKYDDKGHIVETTARDTSNNSILSREVYTYEFDAVGNWTKMNTFLVVFEAGTLRYEPTEVTYRNIAYYYNQSIADLTEPTRSPTAATNESPLSLTLSGGETETEQASASLRTALDEWIAATNARDIEKQMSFYAPTIKTYYRANNVSRQFVRAEKTRVFQQADLIDVRATEPEISVDQETRTATMRFRKQYVIEGSGHDRRGEVLQQLRWQLTNEGWKIVGERDLKVIR